MLFIIALSLLQMGKLGGEVDEFPQAPPLVFCLMPSPELSPATLGLDASRSRGPGTYPQAPQGGAVWSRVNRLQGWEGPRSGSALR